MKLDNLKLADEIGGRFIVENSESPLPADILAREFNGLVRNMSRILDMIKMQQDFIKTNAERIEDLHCYLNDSMRAIEDLEELHYDLLFDDCGERLSDNEDYFPAD